MSALDHTAKRATRHELLRTARLLRDRGRRLASIAESLEHQADELEREGRGEGGMVLGGHRITDVLEELVALYARHHYTELDAILLKAGYVVGGVEGRATLLAALNRSPHWERLGKRTGIYRRIGPVKVKL